jgi:hypothetical protein
VRIVLALLLVALPLAADFVELGAGGTLLMKTSRSAATEATASGTRPWC